MFLYGPHSPLHSEHYLKVRVLPKLLAELSVMFRYYSCRFSGDQVMKDARLPPKHYTLEISSFGFLDRNRATIPYTESSLQLAGCRLAYVLNEQAAIEEQDRRDRLRKAIMMSSKRKTKKAKHMLDILKGLDDGFSSVTSDKNEVYSQPSVHVSPIKKIRK